MEIVTENVRIKNNLNFLNSAASDKILIYIAFCIIVIVYLFRYNFLKVDWKIIWRSLNFREFQENSNDKNR